MAFAKLPFTSSVLMIQIVLLLGVVVAATLASSDRTLTGIDDNGDRNPSAVVKRRRLKNSTKTNKSGKAGKTKSSKNSETQNPIAPTTVSFDGAISTLIYKGSIDCDVTDSADAVEIPLVLGSLSTMELGTFCLEFIDYVFTYPDFTVTKVFHYEKHQVESCKLQKSAKSSKKNKSSHEQDDEILQVTYVIQKDCESDCGTCSGDPYQKIDKYPDGFGAADSCYETELAEGEASIKFSSGVVSSPNLVSYWKVINNYSCIYDYPNILPEPPVPPV